MSENILGALDARTRPSGSERTVPSLLADAVAAAPGAVALEQGGSVLTYADLDSLTSVVARWLVAEGVGPKSVVVLAIERSAELAVAWWSVMKAGGCVVRLGPSEPRERVEVIVRDCGAVLGLAMSPDIAVLSAATSERCRFHALDELDLDNFSADTVTVDTDTVDDPSSMLRGDHPALLDYSAGTTGAVITQAATCAATRNFADPLVGEIVSAARTRSTFGAVEAAPVSEVANESDAARTLEENSTPVETLSAAESRLWTLNRSDPQSCAYNLSSALALVGRVDVERLESAVRAVALRHEPLRTVYPEGVDGPGRAVLDAPTATTALTTTTAADDDVTAAMFAFAERGFDLTSSAPFRASLITVADTNHVLVVVMHRIAADEASLDIVVRDIFDAYASPDRVTPVSYSDYRQRRNLSIAGGVGDTDRAFWMRALRDVTVVEVPTDRPRPDSRSLDSGSVARALSADTRTALSQLATSRAVPISSVVHAAFAVVLSSLSGTRDVTVATDVTGREDDAAAALVGPIANTVVCRLDVDPTARVGNLVDAAARSLADARAHSTLPFESLVQELDSEDAKAHPITRIALSFRDVVHPPRGIVGLDITAVELDVEASEFDLHLAISDDAELGRMRLGLIYSAALFDRRTAKSILDMLIGILGVIAATPSTRVEDIEVGSIEAGSVKRGRHRTPRS